MARSTKRHILIASSEYDRRTVLPVVEKLKKQGCQVTYYKSDLVTMPTKKLNVQVGDYTDLISYDETDINGINVDAAWYRRPSNFVYEGLTEIQQVQVADNVDRLQRAIWQSIAEHKWINDPMRMNFADDKFTQLRLASKLGFKVPKTVISNDGQVLLEAFPKADAVFKLPSGTISMNGEAREIYTNVLSQKKLIDLVETGKKLLPGIYQERIPKAKEWRITVVGEQVFPAAIYTDVTAKDDWRKLQTTDAVRFKKEQFDQALTGKLVTFLKKLNLRYGAFDLIEAPNGEIYFLEINPNGQYQWLEDELGMPISSAIADELARIANAN